MSLSDLACQSCRKRKVKCDRTLPRCMVCEQTRQTCNYPLRSMKPGPKIGSSQKKRKRLRQNETAQRRPMSSHSRPPPGPENGRRDSSFDAFDDQLEKEELVLAVPADLTEATGIEARGSSQQRTSQLNTLDLAFILHPSHEVTTPSQKQSPSSPDGQQTDLCRQACTELGVSQASMNKIIRVFFDNMVAIDIFHEPSFAEKLSNIPSFCQLTALLAAIAGYATRFGALRTNDGASDAVQLAAKSHRQPAYFIDLAFKYINEALAECDDEMPPLCVIQALILATHCRLTQGVRGKAWRSLGLCVSLIYETNLHLLDSRKVIQTEDPHRWQEDEEKRRAFWAIWEMDVFASTIRRTPTTINWNQMEIWLPVDNAHWFSGHPASSCFMEADINKRWKALQDSGNQSSKAWFLVINSLMKNAQIACDPLGMPAISNQGYHQQMPNSQISTADSAMEARQKLETLANAVRCFTWALPSHLQYRDQYLAFGAPVQGELESQRRQHCSIYNIFVMTQLTRLMIYRYDAFRSQNRPTETSGRHPSGDSAGRNTFGLLETENEARRQYYEAADRILGIVNRSCEDHVQHINPFLPSTIWLASAVQLVRKHFARAQSNRDLVKSRFDVLYLTYKRCVQFWDIQTALQKNLELIEEQLDARNKKLEVRACPTSHEASNQTSEDTDMINQSASDQDGHNVERGLNFDRTARQASQYIPETPSVPLTSSTPIDVRLDITAQIHAQKHPYVGDSLAMLDYMTPPQLSRNQVPEEYMVPPNSHFLDTIYQLDQALDWPTFDFPGGIYDLLSG
ncbi:hypothetical protein COH20_007110 [Aspergillus flavus]|nr:hypothetical protein COH21_012072 [Aspergillus flavus]RAQ66726.1 hypothetical protein COH20_007110 [Aspergillus flavus]